MVRSGVEQMSGLSVGTTQGKRHFMLAGALERHDFCPKSSTGLGRCFGFLLLFCDRTLLPAALLMCRVLDKFVTKVPKVARP